MPRKSSSRRSQRQGSIIVLAAVLTVVFVGMVAFAVDYGYILATRAELQRSADAAALAAVQDLVPDADGTQDLDAARATVRAYVNQNVRDATFTVLDSDIEFGRFDTASIYSGVTILNSGTFDTVRVTLRRDGSTNPLVSLFFAQALGVSEAEVTATATAVLQKATRLVDGSGVLPFAVPEDEWDDLDPGDSWVVYADGQITDEWGDPIPGNWGTLDIGDSNNSTSDLRDQIENGLRQEDIDALYDDGRISSNTHIDTADTISLNGDPGLSAGMSSAVEAVHGQTRVIPLYSSTNSAPGNNLEFEIVRWGVVTVVDSNFKGKNKHVTVQRSYMYSGNLLPNVDLRTAATIDGAFTSPVLVE